MSDDECVLQHLRECTLGAVLNDRHLKELAAIVEPVHSSAGSVIFAEGSTADALYVVCAGAVALEMQVPLRSACRVLTLGPRDLLGWSALVGDGSMSASATVTEDADLMKLPADKLKDLCIDDHTLGYAVMGNVARALANRLKGTRLQLLDLYAETEPTQPKAKGEGA